MTLEIREAYENSAHYRRAQRGIVVPGTVGAALPREPGCDDGMPSGLPADLLERDFGAQP